MPRILLDLAPGTAPEDRTQADCHWPDAGLTVELLSYRYHATRHAFEHDVARRRRSDHVAYTYGDVTHRGAPTIAELRARLIG